MNSAYDADVLVVGAGPVGLTLAIDLARRGVTVPMRRLQMERCNARTMEFFRRMGLAEKVRAASRFRDVPMDVFIVTSLADPPILHRPIRRLSLYSVDTSLVSCLPARKRGEVAACYAVGRVMGHGIGVAHDPSVADYRATSPASPGRRARIQDVSIP